MWLYCSLAESESASLLFKDQRQKDVKDVFLKLSYDTLRDFYWICKLFVGDDYSLYPYSEKYIFFFGILERTFA